jgi:hypothetical protein
MVGGASKCASKSQKPKKKNCSPTNDSTLGTKKSTMETSNMCTRQTFKWQNLHLSIVDDKFAPKQ